MKAFISYSTEDKEIAASMKLVLDSIGIEAFLAHDDIHVSEEWQNRILQELEACDIFIPLLNQGFKGSDWCGQEVGIAASRDNVLIFPVSLDGTIPYGFIAKIQGHRLRGERLGKQEILQAIATKWPGLFVDKMMPILEQAGSFRQAEGFVELFVPYFEELTSEQANQFAQRCIDNGQIWDAMKCQKAYLPNFLEKNRDKLDPKLYKILEFQITNSRWYDES